MAIGLRIRPLTVEDAEDFRALRLEGLLNRPSAFGSSYEEECRWSIPQVRQKLTEVWAKPPAALFGAFSGDRMIGTIGIYPGGLMKSRHKMTIWGMYVTPAYRNSGAGHALMTAALAHARVQDGIQRVDLTVEADNDEAKRLYKAFGFRPWGTEPDAVVIGDRAYDDEHMSLALSS